MPTSAEDVCQGFGPQTPRDIDQKAGENPRVFGFAPESTQMNLCNIHFHKHAEHKARAYSVAANPGHGHSEHPGVGGGFRCNDSEALPAELLQPAAADDCKLIEAGDTIEVHWVHTSCDITPGPTLGACLSPDNCANPGLRVEAQVFLLVNDPAALDFAEFAYGGNVVNGYHQAKTLPGDTGEPVKFLGSTTGPKYNDGSCSNLQVSWSVRPECARLDIHSLHRWCKDNAFNEHEAHGVRHLVTDVKLLSPID
ncbi:MAG: delta-class carbonic anhydrase [Acidobacteriota bacterium]